MNIEYFITVLVICLSPGIGGGLYVIGNTGWGLEIGLLSDVPLQLYSIS